jgi:hypothetical protein
MIMELQEMAVTQTAVPSRSFVPTWSSYCPAGYVGKCVDTVKLSEREVESIVDVRRVDESEK